MKTQTARPARPSPYVGIAALFLLAVSAQTPPTEPASTYTLGPDDQISIRAVDVEEISTTNSQTGGGPIRIDSRGNINLPLVGRIHAAGMTTDQLATEIESRLKKYVQDPDVSVYLVEMRSQPISVLGAVQAPGVHQLQGRKTLFEVISLAGGLRQDAGYTVKITRRKEWGSIPLPDAKDDPTGQFSVGSVSVKSIMQASSPEENIEIKPNDVITVPKADLVYVVGCVKKPGGFVLEGKETISALQALSLAEGFDRAPKSQEAKIMRQVAGSDQRAEIPVDLRKMLAGKAPDVKLRADDILFIPTSMAKNAAIRGIEAAISIGSGLAIYRP